jgi:transcriptional regulator with XRE-family HTH domain
MSLSAKFTNNDLEFSPGPVRVKKTQEFLFPCVTSAEVRTIRKTLGLTVDNFALLLGVSSSSVFRYESAGLQNQGPVARKLSLLSFWLGVNQSLLAIKKILVGDNGLPQNGLAILAGLLETGHVLSCLTRLKQAQIPASLGLDAGSKPPETTQDLLPALSYLAELMLQSFYQAEPWSREISTNPNIAGTTTTNNSNSGNSSNSNSDNNDTSTVATANGLTDVNHPLTTDLLAANIRQTKLPPKATSQADHPSMADHPSTIEYEARIMEAEARKLEAQARKLEAQARLNSVQKNMVI